MTRDDTLRPFSPRPRLQKPPTPHDPALIAPRAPRRSVIGPFFCFKSLQSIWTASEREFHFLMMATIARSVASIERNIEHRVRFVASGKTRTHWPDFIVRLRDGSAVLWEVKDVRALREQRTVELAEHAPRAALRMGFRWRLATDLNFRSPIRLANAGELNRWGSRLHVDPAHVRLVCDLFGRQAEISIADASRETRLRVQEARAALMHLAAWGRLATDLERPFDRETRFRSIT